MIIDYRSVMIIDLVDLLLLSLSRGRSVIIVDLVVDLDLLLDL